MTFGKSKEKTPLKTILTEIVNRTNDNTMRLRRVEQETQSIETKANSINENLLNWKKVVDNNIKELKDTISKQEKKLIEMEKATKEVVKYVKRLPKAEELEELKELVGIYNPLKSQFVTKEEINDIVKAKK